MNLKQQLKDKNRFLRKAYEAAYEYAPSSPLSVSIKPREFGQSIGFNDAETKRIIIELVEDGYVESSLGMGMLLVTRAGLEYLRAIEDEPFVTTGTINDVIAANNLNDNKNISTMKQVEKLDLILKGLYQYKNDGKYYSIADVCKEYDIPIDSIIELNSLGHRLKNDGFIDALFHPDDCLGQLTSHGIDYCEGDSYSNKGHSVVTNNYSVSIVNSPNANIVSQSSHVSITQNNTNEANQAVERIREVIATDNSINAQLATDILECLNEIQENLKNNQKPKFAIKSLIDITSGISSIASFVLTLGQFAGIVPVLGS